MSKRIFKLSFIQTYALTFMIVLLCIGFVSRPVNAQSIVKLQPTKDQSAVYLKPDFDAKVIYLLPKDKKVLGTRSTVEGLNGLGLFHKVKLSNKIYGYMLDTEVQILNDKITQKKSPKNGTKKKSFLSDPGADRSSKNNLRTNSKNNKSERTNLNNNKSSAKSKSGTTAVLQDAAKPNLKKSQATENEIAKDPEKFSLYPNRFKMEKKRKKNNEPLIYSRLIGAQLGLVNYTEKTQSGKRSSQELVYGVKLTGTNLLFRNFWVDIGVNFHFGAPSLFDDFATNTSGFFMLVDLTMPFVLSRTRTSYFYGGLGPMLNISFFDFTLAGDEESSQKIRLGGVGTLGLAYDLSSNWAFKVEGKYYFESSSYWGALAGLQKRF